jgi:hypothetical protein
MTEPQEWVTEHPRVCQGFLERRVTTARVELLQEMMPFNLKLANSPAEFKFKWIDRLEENNPPFLSMKMFFRLDCAGKSQPRILIRVREQWVLKGGSEILKESTAKMLNREWAEADRLSRCRRSFRAPKSPGKILRFILERELRRADALVNDLVSTLRWGSEYHRGKDRWTQTAFEHYFDVQGPHDEKSETPLAVCQEERSQFARLMLSLRGPLWQMFRLISHPESYTLKRAEEKLHPFFREGVGDLLGALALLDTVDDPHDALEKLLERKLLGWEEVE